LLDLGALHIVAQASTPVNENQIGRISEHRPEACATQITPIGRKMLAFPLHPRYSRMLLAAHEYGCVHQACLVAALTQGRDLLLHNVDATQTRSARICWGRRRRRILDSHARWTYAAKNQFRLDACRRLGIHAVTRGRSGRCSTNSSASPNAKAGRETARGQGRGVAKMHSDWFFRPRGAPARPGHAPLRIGPHRRGVLARESAVQHSPLFVAPKFAKSKAGR